MPTYDLTCSHCGHRFELFVMRLLRDDDLVCPECGSTEVKKGFGGGYVAPVSSGSSAAGSSCGTGRFT